MNDENTSSPGSRFPRKRTAAAAAAVGVAGLVAGGLAAGAISAASAASDDANAGRPGYGAGPGYGGGRHGAEGGDPSKSQRSDEKLLTGTTRAKVLAAVKAKYPEATIQRVETDSDGVYEAHIINAGKPLTVKVGKDFTITGTESGPSGHGGPGHGGPDRDGDHDGGQGPGGEGSGTTTS